MNLNLPTKNDADRKSPLKLRVNLPGVQVNNLNSSRGYSNTLPLTPKSPNDPSSGQNGPTGPVFSFQQQTAHTMSNSNFQSMGSVPLKTTPLHANLQNSTPENKMASLLINSSGGQNMYMSMNLTPRGTGSPISPELVMKDSFVPNINRSNTLNDASRLQNSIGPGGRPSELNDNLSTNSKISTNSRTLLRAISVNNEDHLMNLNNKEDMLKNQNILIVNNFIQSMEGAKRNVMRNMADSFNARIQEIWTSYLKDQLKSAPPNVDVNTLNNDVDMIRRTFLEVLLSKANSYIEELRHENLAGIFNEIDAKNSQKHYLDERVRDIVENSYNPIKGKNIELNDTLKETRLAYKRMIEQTVEKYKRLRETHIDMYDREFSFKLNGDAVLVKSTLRSGLAFLQEQNKRADEKANALKSKASSIEALQNEIQFLENQIKLHQV